jgi:hypothetical protein
MHQTANTSWLKWVVFALIVLPTFYVVRTARAYTKQARYLKSADEISVVNGALRKFKERHGVFPEAQNFESLVRGDSELVKDGLFRPGLESKDSYGQTFSGYSTKERFRIEFHGDPSNQDERPFIGYDSSEP